MVELNSKGALTLIKPISKEKKGPEPVFRNAYGKRITQDRSVFKNPQSRKRGIPIQKSMFIDFIKAQFIKARGE